MRRCARTPCGAESKRLTACRLTNVRAHSARLSCAPKGAHDATMPREGCALGAAQGVPG